MGDAQGPECGYCGVGIQDAQHLFRDCPRFAESRDDWIEDALQQWTARKEKARERNESGTDAGRKGEVEETTQEVTATQLAEMRSYLESTVSDCAFWIGHTPPLSGELTPFEARAAHMFAVTLTARIASIHMADQRQITRRRAARFKALMKKDG